MRACRHRTSAGRQTDALQAPASGNRKQAATESVLSVPDRPTALGLKSRDRELARSLRSPRAIAPGRPIPTSCVLAASASAARTQTTFSDGVADTRPATTIVSFATISTPRNRVASSDLVFRNWGYFAQTGCLALKLFGVLRPGLRVTHPIAAIRTVVRVDKTRIHRFGIGSAARKSLRKRPGHDHDQEAWKRDVSARGKARNRLGDQPRHRHGDCPPRRDVL